MGKLFCLLRRETGEKKDATERDARRLRCQIQTIEARQVYHAVEDEAPKTSRRSQARRLGEAARVPLAGFRHFKRASKAGATERLLAMCVD